MACLYHCFEIRWWHFHELSAYLQYHRPNRYINLLEKSIESNNSVCAAEESKSTPIFLNPNIIFPFMLGPGLILL